MPKSIRNLIYRLRNACRFFKYGFGALLIKDEVVSDVANTIANDKTDTTMTDVPTLDAIKDMIANCINMRAKLMRMEQDYSENEQLTHRINVNINNIEYNLLFLRIAELIVEFSLNNDELVDKILHMVEKEYVIISLARVKNEMSIFNKFIDKYEYGKKSSSVEM